LGRRQPEKDRLMDNTPPGWKPIHTAPAETDICICIKDAFGPYRLPFPCQRKNGRWINSRAGVRIDVQPLGWTPWQNRHARIAWKARSATVAPSALDTDALE
jgi:hypothetical protein